MMNDSITRHSSLINHKKRWFSVSRKPPFFGMTIVNILHDICHSVPVSMPGHLVYKVSKLINKEDQVQS